MAYLNCRRSQFGRLEGFEKLVGLKRVQGARPLPPPRSTTLGRFSSEQLERMRGRRVRCDAIGREASRSCGCGPLRVRVRVRVRVPGMPFRSLVGFGREGSKPRSALHFLENVERGWKSRECRERVRIPASRPNFLSRNAHGCLLGCPFPSENGHPIGRRDHANSES
jgi:hypothetical protein